MSTGGSGGAQPPRQGSKGAEPPGQGSKGAEAPGASSPEGAETVHGFGGSPECQLCPVCVLLQALGSTRPEVTQHLLAAARELALAFRTFAEGQAEASDRAQAVMRDRAAERLRRIDLD